MELEDETGLVARLLSGDSRAMEQLAYSYRGFISSIFTRQPHLSPDDIEELYQRFLFHIWEDGYRRLRPWKGTRSLRAYLGVVARNLARDYRRERRRNSCEEICADVMAAPGERMPMMDSGRSEIVKRGLGNLSVRDRELIHRRYYRDESYREIAEALGITVNHVGVALMRAETRLKLALQKHRGDL
jgi:RNA polymerase sigma-70 factor (ECF subfamily)